MKRLALIAGLTVLLATGCGGEAGHYTSGTTALDESGACLDVFCSSHGFCYQENDRPFCQCDEGYHAVGLECLLGGAPRPDGSRNWCGVGDLIVATAVAEEGRGPNQVGHNRGRS